MDFPGLGDLGGPKQSDFATRPKRQPKRSGDRRAQGSAELPGLAGERLERKEYAKYEKFVSGLRGPATLHPKVRKVRRNSRVAGEGVLGRMVG